MDYNPPNTRERIAARRQRRRSNPPPAGAPQATPGARQSLLAWVGDGRLVGLMLCVAACGVLLFMLTSPQFSVRAVTVQGNSALDSGTVAALAGVVGRPIWYVRPSEVVARLSENAYVESARVELALPDRASISIVERRPEVRWAAGGVQYLVDRSGKVLGPAQEPAAADVLVITDNSHLALEPNEQIDIDAVRLAQELALRLPVELGFTPAQIGWDFGLGVYTRSALGQTIVFGRSEELPRKLAVLAVLLKDGTPFSYLDLRPANPFYQNVPTPGSPAVPTRESPPP